MRHEDKRAQKMIRPMKMTRHLDTWRGLIERVNGIRLKRQSHKDLRTMQNMKVSILQVGNVNIPNTKKVR